MKKTLNCLLFAFCSVLILGSCSKKDTTQPPSNNNNNNNNTPPPIIKLTLSSTNASTGSPVTISFVGSSTINIKSFVLKDILSGDTAGVVIQDSAFSTKQLAYATTFTTGVPGSRNIKVIVTDDNNQSTSDIQPLIITGNPIPTDAKISEENNATVEPLNSSFNLAIEVSGVEPLKHIKITRIIAQTTPFVICDSDIHATNVIFTRHTVAPKDYTGAADYKLEVTDIRNKITSNSTTITFIKKLAYSGFYIGAQQNSSHGNFVSTPDFNIYNSSTGASHSSSIAFGYFDDPNYGPIIASPKILSQVYPMSSWPVLNQTLFHITSYNRTINQNETEADLKNIFQNLGGSSNGSPYIQINGNGDEYVYYLTPDGRYGEIHVEEVDGGPDGRIFCEILSE